MLLIVDYPHAYTLLDKEFFETLDRLEPRREDFIDLTSARLPAGWKVKAHNIWCYCEPPEVSIPSQGWKIHVSGTVGNATMILATVTDILAADETPFKFAADQRVLHLLNGKRWSRGGAGKFMTVYPRDPDHCARLLETLHQQLIGFKGPHVLSDRRYLDSSTVHYRYGGIKAVRQLSADGRRVPVITSQDGTLIPDQRNAYFSAPENIHDPFQPDEVRDDDGYPADTLKNGRYRVERAIVFSNAGGVYIATDTTNDTSVIIKEARPLAGQSKYGDAVLLLKKEERILRKLGPTGVVPRLIDFFMDWQHAFLVEEFVDGYTLRGHNAGHSILLLTRPTREQLQTFVDDFCTLYLKLADAMDTVHRRGIVLVDVSHYNIMVSPGAERVRFIDFDGAYEPGVDIPTFMQTPGFAPNEDVSKPRNALDDWYGFGSLMLATLFPINDMMVLDRSAFRPFLECWMRDTGIPRDLGECITALLDLNPGKRPSVEHIKRVLGARYEVGEPKTTTFEADQTDLPLVLRGITDYIKSKMTLDRDDRLVPASADVFETNPLSVAFGACGVAYALQRIDGVVPTAIIDWILRHPVTVDRYPPGFHVGTTGIAWTLLELGLREDAERILKSADDHPLLRSCPDLFNGVAGWGMGQLRFFLSTGDERYLDGARQAGEHLLETRIANEESDSCHWQNGKYVFCGLGHGSAGVSLFLLYLSLATHEERYLAAGKQGLNHVIGSAVGTPDGGFSWLVDQSHVTRTPYWRWGSAGIGAVLLRYMSVLGPDTYKDTLERTHLDTDRKYAIFPGQQTGLSGIGDFYLDWRQFTPDDPRADESARRLLSGVLLFRMSRDGGVAFPGETRTHISCDYATGSAGMGCFIQRLVAGGDAPYMLDELIRAERAAPRVRSSVPSFRTSDTRAFAESR